MIEPYIFLENNINWLRNWRSNLKEPITDPEGMQLFINHGQSPHGYNAIDSSQLKIYHIKELIMALVFGQKAEIMSNGRRMIHLSGFLEQVGRLPQPKDKVEIISLKDSWFEETQYKQKMYDRKTGEYSHTVFCKQIKTKCKLKC